MAASGMEARAEEFMARAGEPSGLLNVPGLSWGTPYIWLSILSNCVLQIVYFIIYVSYFNF